MKFEYGFLKKDSLGDIVEFVSKFAKEKGACHLVFQYNVDDLIDDDDVVIIESDVNYLLGLRKDLIENISEIVDDAPISFTADFSFRYLVVIPI